ncbi:Aste57867_18256 [Aphanomyces stellatus]|uniref:glucan endo-1,3-beta-D-glucosidase n=1 Tax=Aphanomyces stellatus TaxID=120398 RepID=A0A485L9Z1_9STRA|nr:hypothetical protein As57867_018194 [Aphanomyces stellatus]VFT94993.1 Aste57867_18256 [Aphanomyces stellatus]
MTVIAVASDLKSEGSPMSRLRVFLLLAAAISSVLTFQYPNVTHPLQKPLTFLHPALHGKPFPTEAFWNNLVLGQGEQVVVTYPYAFRVQKNKLHISYPFRVVSPKNIIQGFTPEWLVDLGPNQVQIQAFDELSVTAAFPQPNGGAIRVHFVRGSPYVTLEFERTTPVLSSSLNIVSVTPTDQYTQATLGNWHQWLFFGSTPIQWSQQGQKLVGPPNFSGIIRLSLALQDNFKPLLAAHAPIYPIGATVSYAAANDTTMNLSFMWTTKTYNASSTTPLLMLALPHHLQVLAPSQPIVNELQYMCMRGPMVGVLGSVWTMQETLLDVPWDYPEQGIFASPASSDKYQKTVAFIQNALANDIDRFPAFTDDSYNFGKQLGREARLVLTAHRFNSTAVFDKGLQKIQDQLVNWLTGPGVNKTKNTFVYDASYGGLITLNGYKNQAEDYGNGHYNDHHFHYGYFIYGLAVVRRFNASFVEAYKDAIQYILSDITSPAGHDVESFFANFPQRELFPSARHKDWYCGHSYASGLDPYANGKSQESTSEAVNAYYATALFTSTEADPAYYNYARLLLATEIRSTQLYWQMSAAQSPTIYEPTFSANKMVGVLSDMDAVYSTWFGDRPAFIHGIQIIPVTPITASLLLPSYVVEQRKVLDGLDVISNPADIWSSVLSLNNAIVNATHEWHAVQATDYNYDSWSSAANAMHWIASRPSPQASAATKLTAVPPPVCFGHGACSVAGPFGKPLDCCNTLPGCCPSDNPCCHAAFDPATASQHVCQDEPACGLLGLDCCGSPDGCCKPNGGVLLGCCKGTAPKPASPPVATGASDKCFHQPKCAAAGLACCDSPQGCCAPTASGQVLGCCMTNETIKALETCHNEPQCGLLGLSCCDSQEGCCNPAPGTPKLGCCSTPVAVAPPAPKSVSVSVGDGDSATPSTSTYHWTVWKTIAAVGGGIALLGVIYYVVYYLRRKDYKALEQDARTWYCGLFVVITMVAFFYLAFTVKN